MADKKIMRQVIQRDADQQRLFKIPSWHFLRWGEGWRLDPRNQRYKGMDMALNHYCWRLLVLTVIAAIAITIHGLTWVNKIDR